MQGLLGIEPPDDRDGCMQDIHWAEGAFGYFPTYSLGAMAAAQLFEAARRSVPDLMAAIGEGDFAPLTAWLGDNVHALGSKLGSDELISRASGRPLGTDAFKRHLRHRYLA